MARAVARGRTNCKVVEVLHVSTSAVRTHITTVRSKLVVRNRVEIAVWAWEHGLVP
ncbi:response regulator transcription factor [Pseudonocardia sp. KRD-169]|uniref:Response regulator transcription factor n=1 Tax=Pseudonocardia abyssalis TaxID=2792008 RepID=A0ABS6UZJ7_9PSEU|nr:response regulator transcription factor [Pseudonocardia abyssalis]MBW0137690.1 response regulator transcription factor [Pseudonocardia abyssalis]